MRHLLITLLFLSLSATFVHADPELKGTPTELANYLSSLPKEVSLTGEAKMEIQAESGTVTIGIKSEDPKLQVALLNNQIIRKEIIVKLDSFGIAQSKIKGTKFSSTPEYGLFGKKPNNYVVENILKVTVENEKELQGVAGIVDNYKEVFYQGIELKEQEKDEIKKRLLNMALTNAKAKQKIYETEFGIILKPISFEENISVEEDKMRRGRIYKDKPLLESRSGYSSNIDDLSLGEHIYHGSVNIKYIVISEGSK